MAVFTTNQVRHFYVATEKVEDVKNSIAKGSISLHKDAEGKIYFKYLGAGGPIRSDFLDPKNGISVKVTNSEDLERKCNKATVTLEDGVSLVPGNDYVVRIKINNYYSLGYEPAMFQFGVVHAVSGMNAQTFFAKLAESLNKNVNKGEEKILEITSTSNSLIVEEIPQTNNYKRGVYSVKPINFEIYCNEVSNMVTLGDGSIISEDVTWGKVEYSKSATKVVSGAYALADMEHFYMGERGDIYRNNVARIGLDTEYMIDLEEDYSTIDIHHAFTDTGTESYRSEKDIIIVGTDDVITAIKASLDELMGIPESDTESDQEPDT